MVFNERTYPNFCRLLKKLGVAAQDSDMSFSVRCERTGLEYQGSSLNGLFAQRRNLLNLPFLGMFREILRFNRRALAVLDEHEKLTLGEYLAREKFGRRFVNQYLVPMASAIWSARPETLLDFPARFLIGFFRNHGLLQIRDRPQWKTIAGGARSYVAALVAPLRDRIRLNCPVQGVTRFADRVLVQPRGGEAEVFDQVVLASHADQTLAMLTDADRREREILSAFPYQRNETIVHTECRLLPRLERAWASWNYHIPKEENQPVAVTYDLSRLQQVRSPQPILATLNQGEQIDPEKTLQRIEYHHPAYTVDSIDAQKAASGDQRPAADLFLRRLLGLRLSRKRRQQRTQRGAVFWEGTGLRETGDRRPDTGDRRTECIGIPELTSGSRLPNFATFVPFCGHFEIQSDSGFRLSGLRPPLNT